MSITQLEARITELIDIQNRFLTIMIIFLSTTLNSFLHFQQPLNAITLINANDLRDITKWCVEILYFEFQIRKIKPLMTKVPQNTKRFYRTYAKPYLTRPRSTPWVSVCLLAAALKPSSSCIYKLIMIIIQLPVVYLSCISCGEIMDTHAQWIED